MARPDHRCDREHHAYCSGDTDSLAFRCVLQRARGRFEVHCEHQGKENHEAARQDGDEAKAPDELWGHLWCSPLSLGHG